LLGGRKSREVEHPGKAEADEKGNSYAAGPEPAQPSIRHHASPDDKIEKWAKGARTRLEMHGGPGASRRPAFEAAKPRVARRP